MLQLSIGNLHNVSFPLDFQINVSCHFLHIMNMNRCHCDARTLMMTLFYACFCLRKVDVLYLRFIFNFQKKCENWSQTKNQNIFDVVRNETFILDINIFCGHCRIWYGCGELTLATLATWSPVYQVALRSHGIHLVTIVTQLPSS